MRQMRRYGLSGVKTPRKWARIGTFAVLFVFLACAFVFGADDAADTWLQFGWDKLFYAIGVVVAGFVTALLKKLGKKYGIEISGAQEELVKQYALDAIGYAEEWGYKKLKIDKVAVKSEEKFNKAVEKLLEKVPGLDAEKARSVIVSKLPEFRIYLGNKIDEVIEKKLKGGNSEG
jgi:hypothetical protein